MKSLSSYSPDHWSRSRPAAAVAEASHRISLDPVAFAAVAVAVVVVLEEAVDSAVHVHSLYL